MSMHRFDNYFEYQKELAAKVLVSYFESHRIDLNGKKVADIGCGEGGIEAGLVERYPKAGFTCFDRNETYLAKARAQNIPRCEFLSYALLDQPEFVDRFDFVIFREVIQSTIEPLALMKKIKTVSKPGSLLHVAFPPYASPCGGHQHVARPIKDRKKNGRVVSFKVFWKSCAPSGAPKFPSVIFERFAVL